MLAIFNIAGWNGLILFGVQEMPAGRRPILAYTMPMWSVLFSLFLLHEPLSQAQDRRVWRSACGHGACCSVTTSPRCGARRWER